MIAHIAAVGINGEIGKGQTLPWHVPEDLAYFKIHTQDCPLIMGRKTFESLPGVLPKRAHIVLSRIPFTHPKAIWAPDLDSAIRTGRTMHNRLWIIGGGEVFAQSFNVVNSLYLTRIMTRIQGADAFYPSIPTDFICTQKSHTLTSKAGIQYCFELWTRKNPIY